MYLNTHYSSMLLNKMILITSLLTRVLHDRFKLHISVFSEGDKVSEYYSRLKLMIQAHLYVTFFTTFFTRHISLTQFHWNIKLLQSSKIFEHRNDHEVSCIWNFCKKFFKTLNSKKYNCNCTYNYNRKTWIDIPFYIFSIVWYNRVISRFFRTTS